MALSEGWRPIVAGIKALRRGHFRGQTALAIGLLLVFGALHAWPWRFIGDDAYIALRYAQNLGRYGLPTYNLPPEDAVEGYTSPLWVGLLAGAEMLGLDLVTSAWFLNASASAFAIALLVLASPVHCLHAADQRMAKIAGWFFAVWLVAQPIYVVWASSGLETSLAAVLGIGCLVAIEYERWRMAVVLLSLAALTRLDNLTWILPALAMQGWAWRGVKKKWHSLALVVGVAALVVGIHAFARRLYYGAWLPNTWAAKAHGSALAETWGADYLGEWASDIAWWWGLPWLVWGLLRDRRLIAAMVGNLVYVYAIGGDFMGYSRFLLPSTLMLAWLARDAVAHAACQPHRWIRIVAIAWMGLGIVWQVAQIAPRWHLDQRQTFLGRGFETVHAMDEFAAVRRAAGEAWARELPSSTRISVGAAGAFPFQSGFVAFDVFGLVDREVAQHGHVPPRQRPGHAILASAEQINAHQPDLFCQNGWVDVQKPDSRELRRRVAGPAQWACIKTGPVVLSQPHAKALPSHYYCCVRRLDQTVTRPSSAIDE